VCYEYQNRIDCNRSCYTQCADSYNPATQTSWYNKLCGFTINEPITLRNTSTNCTGDIQGTYTLTGAGTAGIGITMPFETGTESHSYDICAGSTFIQRITVEDCGAGCSITLPTNALIANQGTNTSLNVTLANQDAGGDYTISLKRYEDDYHAAELAVPSSLDYPLEKNVSTNGSTSFTIDAINPQAEEGLTHWANIIIKASGPDSCEVAFDYDVIVTNVCQGDIAPIPPDELDCRVNLSDLVIMKNEFLRINCNNPDPCYADIAPLPPEGPDNRVNISDLVIMKNEFLRIDCCP